MKQPVLLLIACLIAAGAAAQYRPSLPADKVTEKRFVTAVEKTDPAPYLLDTTTGELWKLDPATLEWRFIGEPRGAQIRRKGNYRLQLYRPGEVLIVDSDTGEAWWTDGTRWKRIEEPSSLRRN